MKYWGIDSDGRDVLQEMSEYQRSFDATNLRSATYGERMKGQRIIGQVRIG